MMRVAVERTTSRREIGVPRMKRVLTLGFLLMGFSFTVTQGLLIRELLVAFFDNEL